MKIICVGRNYRDHAAELNNPVPEVPIIFMKPATSLLVNNKPFYYPAFTKELHYEVEMVLKICKNGRHIEKSFASSYFDQIALGIDFTARDIQQILKQKGHPWELAKAFDHSAVLSSFYPVEDYNIDRLDFSLRQNGTVVQQGNTSDLIFPFDELLCFISQYFKLQVGDLIFTGTPAGVGAVQIGDTLEGYLENTRVFTCEIK